jgi:hypothetical protein
MTRWIIVSPGKRGGRAREDGEIEAVDARPNQDTIDPPINLRQTPA